MSIQWRPYQQAALQAFEMDVAKGRFDTHIVAPPGCGKTLIGAECIRRYSNHALVLVPTLVIGQQWKQTLADHCKDTQAHVYTYQSLLTADAEAWSTVWDTLILDECHHLTLQWGSEVALLRARNPRGYCISLTATPPSILPEKIAQNYRKLVGEVDYEIPAPAVVRDGYLAPYAELIHFVQPTPGETNDIKGRLSRVTEWLLDCDSPVEGGLTQWLTMTIEHPTLISGEEVAWKTLVKSRPAYARAAMRWLYFQQRQPPNGENYAEEHRVALTEHDWAALASDWLRQGCSAQRRALHHEAMKSLGWRLGKKTILVSNRDDETLCRSQAKPIGAMHVLRTEEEARGELLRAVILLDRVDPKEGYGAVSVHAMATTDHPLLRPVLLSGQKCLVASEDLAYWQSLLPEWVEYGQCEDSKQTALSAWDSASWTSWFTMAFERGDTRLLIGTRGLLGEGWNAPSANVLIDLTGVAADISVRQMRGRTLRIKPEDKVAHNWDIVCVSDPVSSVSLGTADYARVVRRHSHLLAACEDGGIEDGISHIHPSLSPHHVPTSQQCTLINDHCLQRAQDDAHTRERWKVGTPYQGVYRSVMHVKALESQNKAEISLMKPPMMRISKAWKVGLCAPAAVVMPLHIAVAFAILILGFAAWLYSRGKVEYPKTLPLEWMIEIATAAGCRIHNAPISDWKVEPREDGWLRVRWPSLDDTVTKCVSGALDDMLHQNGTDYWVYRQAANKVAAVRIPKQLGRNKQQRTIFEEEWQRVCGPASINKDQRATEEGTLRESNIRSGWW